MAKAFRPTVSYDVDYEHKQFSILTYAEVKRNMKDYLSESNGVVSVYRHRRGEWGEWFEHWDFNHKKKPVIVKEGWM